MIRMSWTGMLLRVLFVVAFCVGTYNGSGYHLYGLIYNNITTNPFPALLGIVVWLGCALFLLWVARDMLGKVGAIVLLTIAGLSIGWGWHSGLLDGRDLAFWQWAAPSITGLILGLGLISGFLLKFLTGRVATEDPDTVAPE